MRGPSSLILRLFAVIVLVLLAATSAGNPVFAQSDDPLSPEAVAAARQKISNDEINVIAQELWCPLCSGVRLDACELKACEQMKDEIAIKLAAGEDLESIRNYFVGYYGPQVLGEPPLEGFNWLAWVLPVLVLAGGGLYLVLRMRRSAQAAPARVVTHATPPAIEGEYARKLEEELRKHD